MGRRQRALVGAEHLVDAVRRRRRAGRPPEHFRIEVYGGHGGASGVVVRGRVLDNPPASEAVAGEGVGAAVRRSLGSFVTDELPDVPLRVTVADAVAETRTDGEGYFRLELAPSGIAGPWASGTVELAVPYRGLVGSFRTEVPVRVPTADARFGVISDVDDTIIETGCSAWGRCCSRPSPAPS